MFNIKSIEVENNCHVSSEQIINLAELKLNINTFKFSKKKVKNKIMSNPYIEKVNISRNLFTGTVRLSIKERTPALMFEYGSNYVYISRQGYILEISSARKYANYQRLCNTIGRCKARK